MKSKYFVKDRGCFNCPLKCGNLHTVPEGPYKLGEVEGPGYETLMSFGSNCHNANLDSILMANYLCNDLGMDTITCGNLFALLMDLFDLDIIGADQLDGNSLVGEDIAAPRLFQESLADGKQGGAAMSKERFEKVRAMYYAARGWSIDGVPSEEKLKALDLI